MKNFIKNNYHKHLIIGALGGAILVFLLHFVLDQPDYILIMIATFVGFCAGMLWEGEQTYHYRNKWDSWDVIFSGIGASIGSLIILIL
jgi:VanZ family protein